jgi:hypothetical protein
MRLIGLCSKLKRLLRGYILYKRIKSNYVSFYKVFLREFDHDIDICWDQYRYFRHKMCLLLRTHSLREVREETV